MGLGLDLLFATIKIKKKIFVLFDYFFEIKKMKIMNIKGSIFLFLKYNFFINMNVWANF